MPTGKHENLVSADIKYNLFSFLTDIFYLLNLTVVVLG